MALSVFEYDYLVAHYFSPVASIFVRLHYGDIKVIIVQDDGLLSVV